MTKLDAQIFFQPEKRKEKNGKKKASAKDDDKSFLKAFWWAQIYLVDFTFKKKKVKVRKRGGEKLKKTAKNCWPIG